MSRRGGRRYLVAYDVADDKRRDAIYTSLLGFGERVQYSVFICELTATEVARMRGGLENLLHHTEDQIMILHLGRVSHPLDADLDVLGKPFEPTVRSFIV